MRNERVDKLRANVDAWWQLVRIAGHKAEILRPLATDATICARVASGPAEGSHSLLVHTLLFDLIKDVVALTCDGDGRAPSLFNIREMIEDPKVQCRLRRDAVAPKYDYRGVLDDNVPLDLVGSIADDLMAEDSASDAVNFDSQLLEIMPMIGAVLQREVVRNLKTARDKAIEHYEMEMRGGVRQLFEIGGVGLKWGDAESVLQALEEIGFTLNLAVSGAHYDPGERRRLDREAAIEFWQALCGVPLPKA